MKLLDNKAAIVKAIASIKTRGKKLDQDIWAVATSAMAHHAAHGDVTLINELVAAMPAGSRLNALNAFIDCNGAVTYDEDNKCFVHDKDGNFDLEGAMAKSWTEYKPETPYRPFDALAAIKKIALKASADRKEGDKCTKEQTKKILALATEMGIDLTAK